MLRATALALIATLGLAGSVQAAEYRDDRSGHPLKIVYYVAHPVGYLLDRVIFYPAWVVGQYEPFYTLFGVNRVQRDTRYDDLEVEPTPQP